MLVLTRRPGESVVLVLPDGRRVSVTFVQHHGHGAVLGFDAPHDVRIWREELIEGRGRDGRDG